jgi:hypothetical protein
MKKLSRREFVEIGMLTSLAAHAETSPGVLLLGAQDRPKNGGTDKSAFRTGELDSLRAVMDEIIPAQDGMPSCSQAGGVSYLEQLASQDAGARTEMLSALSALEKFSQEQMHRAIPQLGHDQRVQMLVAFQQHDEASFRVIRDSVYEAYYEQQSVWKLIGYEFYATNNMGPASEPFDEQALAEARKRPRFYREVDHEQ